jgi:hypothetical protein
MQRRLRTLDHGFTVPFYLASFCQRGELTLSTWKVGTDVRKKRMHGLTRLSIGIATAAIPMTIGLIPLLDGVSGDNAAAATESESGTAFGTGVTGTAPAFTLSQKCDFGSSPCKSTKPKVWVNWTSNGSTIGCTFTYDLAWGDGSSETVTVQGQESGTYREWNHTYHAAKTTKYTIDLTSTSVTGPCDSASPVFVFKLLVRK